MIEPAATRTSNEIVLDELRALRKRADGASVASIAESPAICQLMGDGDPLVAWSRLQHLVMDAEWSRDIETACYSLGFASAATTHLGRLEEFAASFYVDQRQARRYSDRGLMQISRLIVSNWLLHAIPTCDVVMMMTSPSTCDVYARFSSPTTVKMNAALFQTKSDKTEHVLEPDLIVEQNADRDLARFARPVSIDVHGETSITVQWAGEVWPKFSAQLSGSWRDVDPVIECLGSKMMIRLFPARATTHSSQAEEPTDDSDQRSIDCGNGDQDR